MYQEASRSVEGAPRSCPNDSEAAEPPNENSVLLIEPCVPVERHDPEKSRNESSRSILELQLAFELAVVLAIHMVGTLVPVTR